MFDQDHHDDRKKCRDKVIVAQTCRIIIEEEDHHEREDVHDDAHIGHARLLWRLHVATIQVGVREGSAGH